MLSKYKFFSKIVGMIYNINGLGLSNRFMKDGNRHVVMHVVRTVERRGNEEKDDVITLDGEAIGEVRENYDFFWIAGDISKKVGYDISKSEVSEFYERYLAERGFG